MNFGDFNINNLMAMARDVQSKVAAMKESVQNATYTGSDDDEAIQISMTGKFTPVSVKCDVELFGEEEARILENLIFAALLNVSNAIQSAEQQQRMDLQQSLGIPPEMLNNIPGF